MIVNSYKLSNKKVYKSFNFLIVTGTCKEYKTLLTCTELIVEPEAASGTGGCA